MAPAGQQEEARLGRSVRRLKVGRLLVLRLVVVQLPRVGAVLEVGREMQGMRPRRLRARDVECVFENQMIED